MLPDIRALLAAAVAAIGLLMISFGVVATFRVAQDSRAGSLQADLAQRGRAPVPDNVAPRMIVIVDTPASAERNVVPAAIISEEPAAPAPAVMAAPTAEVEPERPAPPMIAAMPAEPEAPAPSAAIGGPSAEEAAQIDAEQKAAKRARAKKTAAEKARKAHIARQRRAQRAAQARARQQATGSFDTFNNAQFNSFGGYDNKPAAR